MSENEIAVYDADSGDLAMARRPVEVIEEAKKAADALDKVIDKLPGVVKFGAKKHIPIGGWQIIGRFYGITAGVESTTPVDLGGIFGFEARAYAVRGDGAKISTADAMCMSDEPNWKNKPLFQLRSMAQTRAQAKVLRSVLGWVVELAGYSATPAEEVADMAHESGGSGSQQRPGGASTSDAPASEAQVGMINLRLTKAGVPEGDKRLIQVSEWLGRDITKSTKEIRKNEVNGLLQKIDAYKKPKAEEQE